MRITVDTNVLVRALVGDDPEQAKVAKDVMLSAKQICVPITCLCELVWVLRRVYKFPNTDIIAAIRALLNAETVALDRAAAETGLTILASGGDFADGVIAHEGSGWEARDLCLSIERLLIVSRTMESTLNCSTESGLSSCPWRCSVDLSRQWPGHAWRP